MSQHLHLRVSKSFSAAVAVAALLFVAPAFADSVDQQSLDQLKANIAAQRAKLAEQERLLRQQSEELQRQQQQLDALQRALTHSPASPRPVAAGTLDSLRGTGQPETPTNTAQAEPVGQAPQAPEHPPEVNVLSERGGVLTPRGALVWEPALDFSHTTDSRAIISGFTIIPALTIGTIDVTRVNHDILQAVNTFRLGITNRAELEVRVPYVYGRQSTTTRPLNVGSSTTTTTTITGLGLGDVEAAGHYQFNSGQNGWPYFIGNLRFKSRTGEDPFQVPLDANGLETRDPTGSGFYNLEPSLTMIYPSDPAVFFANVGYLYAFGRHVNSPLVGGSADVKPGDAIRFSFGLGFGINEASSFSLGYDYAAFFQTKFSNVSQPGTDLQVGSVLIGYSYRFTDRVSANLTTAIGVTRDAPDTRIIVRVPIRFQVFQ